MAGNAPKHEIVPLSPIIYRYSLFLWLGRQQGGRAAGGPQPAAGRASGGIARRFPWAGGGGGCPHVGLPPGSSFFSFFLLGFWSLATHQPLITGKLKHTSKTQAPQSNKTRMSCTRGVQNDCNALHSGKETQPTLVLQYGPYRN